MANLTWKVKEIKYGCEGSSGWVTVSPTEGGPNTNPKVSISPASNQSDCSYAYVTISASTGDEQTIPVTRCIPNCDCSSLGYTKITGINIPYGGQNNIHIGSYSYPCQCEGTINVTVDGVVLTGARWENGRIYANANANETSERTGWFRFYSQGKLCDSDEVTQDAYVDPCASEDCSSVSVSPASMSFESGGGSASYTVSNSDCWSVTHTENGWITVSDSTVSVGEYEGTENDRTGTITFTFVNNVTGTECEKVINITQAHAQEEPTGCTSFIVDGVTEDNFPSTGGDLDDSALFIHDGTPIGKPDWVTIHMYRWDENPEKMCSDYLANPCVANSLMRQAGLVSNDIHCSDRPYPTLDDMPEIVQGAILKTNEYGHALGTIVYEVDPNSSTESRSCTIKWIVDGVECPSRECNLTQLGTGSTPTENEFKWRNGDDNPIIDVSGNETSVTIPRFISKVNGSNKNATVTSEASWITTSGVELDPSSSENTIQIQQYASTEQYRQGVITLHQIGTTETIKATIRQTGSAACVITKFEFYGEDESTKSINITKGEEAVYYFECSDNCDSQHFTLIQKESPHYTISSDSTEPSMGMASGKFITSNAQLGEYNVEVVVNGDVETHTVNILDTTFNIILSTKNLFGRSIMVNKLKFTFSLGGSSQIHEEIDIEETTIGNDEEAEISVDLNNAFYGMKCVNLALIYEPGPLSPILPQTHYANGMSQEVMTERLYYISITE